MPAASVCVRRPAHHPRPTRLWPLLALLLLLCVVPVPRCSSVGSRQQHNVWYHRLWISGIAVDETSGDVFFSDAANNRIIHQSANGSLLRLYDSFYSPMQLAFYNRTLYVADSTINTIGVIDVQSGTVTFTPPSTHLTSCSALAVNTGTSSVFCVDGYGLSVHTYSPRTAEWFNWIDLSTAPLSRTPMYIADIALQPYSTDEVELWLSDPTYTELYLVDNNEIAIASYSVPYDQLSAIQYYRGGATGVELYTLSQFPEGQLQQVSLIDSNGRLVNSWQVSPPQTALPFFSWAMYVDSQQNMYTAAVEQYQHDEPYTRLTKMNTSGNVVGEWTMNDGADYSPTAIWYDADTTAGGSCAVWMTDSEKGIVRLAADGTVALPFYAAPIDPADNRTAQFTVMAEDGPFDFGEPFLQSTFLLLDAADPSTTKLWRFLPWNSSYILLNTSSARLGPGITGLAVDMAIHFIFISDTFSRTVLQLDYTGFYSAVSLFNSSAIGFVQPAGLFQYSLGLLTFDLFVCDTEHGRQGAVLQINYVLSTVLHVYNDSVPSPYAPLSVTVDTTNVQMYTADINGHVFQYDLTETHYEMSFTTSLVAVHNPIPAAINSIASMTVSAQGNLYMIDAYGRRLIILSWDPTGWDVGNDCLPPMSSSSSSSTAVAFPSVVLSSSSGLSSSSSSSAVAAAAVTSPSSLSAGAIAGVVVGAVVGLAALTLAVVCCCYVSKGKRHGQSDTSNQEASGRDQQQTTAKEKEGAVVEMEGQTTDHTRSPATTVDETDEKALMTGGSDCEPAPSSSVVLSVSSSSGSGSAEGLSPSAGTAGRRRYDYYVVRYEVVAAVEQSEQPSDTRQHSLPQLSVEQPLFTRNQQATPPAARNAVSQPSTHLAARSINSTSTVALSTSTTPSGEFVAPPLTRSLSELDVAVGSAASATPSQSSPAHIPSLQSAWPSNPMFISSVTDLTILGEGSSGIVYRGMYRGLACVVKLPKAVSLTGAAWREWQCHLCLPPHANLVRFLGALPMSANNYLVLSLVRQGSLHSLIASSKTEIGSWYRRPYGVMRCVQDMSAVLQHIHRAGIVHRDVSARNILVDSDGSMVLADLGLAAQQPATDLSPSQLALDESKTAVPVRWTSPECLTAGSQYSSKSDVWSLGVALWEMTARGRLPYGERADTKQCIRPIVARQLQLHVDDDWARWGSLSSVAEWKLAGRVRQVIQLCLTYEVEHRPDSTQLVQMVDGLWDDWKREAGPQAEQLESEWVEYHNQLQQRLGPPEHKKALSEHSSTPPTPQP